MSKKINQIAEKYLQENINPKYKGIWVPKRKMHKFVVEEYMNEEGEPDYITIDPRWTIDVSNENILKSKIFESCAFSGKK